LLIKNNPNILEMLAVPEDCVITKHSLFNLIKQEDFVSKLCINTLGGYATEQIRKARGLNKKINNPIEVEKKNPIDFCYIIENGKTISLTHWLKVNQKEQLFCGEASIDHARDMHALYYDNIAHNCFSTLLSEEDREYNKSQLKASGDSFGLGYKGITQKDSNELRFSSIPKEEEVVALFFYNKDGYTTHCKVYKEYFDWVNKRNVHRYNVAKENDYDPKNMMHCYRLSEMSVEISEGKGIIVRRPNRELMMDIRNGKMEYENILKMSEDLMEKSKRNFEKSTLMDSPDEKKAKETLLKIRKSFYNLK